MQRRFRIIIALFLTLLVSCNRNTHRGTDQQFEELASRFLETYLAAHPEEATTLGDHRYDARMSDYTQAGVDAHIARCEAYLDTLRSIRFETLSAQHMIDYDILRRTLEASLFDLRELREWEWNPLAYNPGDAVYGLIARDFAPLPERMRSVTGRLRCIPGVLVAARTNLRKPPSLHTETAILQNEGTIALLNTTLQPLIDSCPTTLRRELLGARDSAVASLREYGEWLKTDLLPRSSGDFRLGKERYEKKFGHRLDTEMKPAELLALAERDLEATTAAMHGVASELHARLFPGDPADKDTVALIRRVLDHLAADRPDDGSIVDRTRADLEELLRFVREHDLVSLPVDPIDIIVMPEFQRGVAVAYCDSPGALEKNGKTFFAIAPTPAHWTAARKESFYREYNNYMLKNLAVHEAVPGHFLQLTAANRAKAPTLLRSVMSSGVFAEGWATYCEQMMADAGFGGPGVRLQVLKMRLRLLINAIIDQRIHAEGMTEREAMTLMMEKGFQEEGEAAGKWRRACLTSAQLSTYYYGNIKVGELRRRAERKAGSAFSLKAFHDELLSYGTISPKYHAMIMKLPAGEGTTAKL